MEVIVRALKQCFQIEKEAEFSIEANPGTVDAAHLAGLRKMGFNRISFGVQSFHDDELRTLERIHDAREVEDAYGWARKAGFENVNLDLIYGLQGQTMEGWQANLERALALGPDHLSLYALTLEEGTPMTRDVERGRQRGPDLDLQADMFEWSLERMKRAGFQHYEISNWSRPGRECRHNLVYWRNGDWLGLGAGAHSHLSEARFADAASPRRYIELLNESALAPSGGPIPAVLDAMRQVVTREAPDIRREMVETAFLALRLREGLDIAAFERRFELDINAVFGDAIGETMALGLTELRDGRLRVRDEAVLLGDEAFIRFLEPAPIEG
jgi:oxygen-independent coproporphyrinogen-3 oxidase